MLYGHFEIRPAQLPDVERILELIRELAEYERALESVEATADDLQKALFGAKPSAEAIVASRDGLIIGIAVFFHNFSTWTGQSGVYLEDLYVTPGARGQGVGDALLSMLAAIAVERGCRRFEWAVLEWNHPAIKFYLSKGARPMSDWRTFRVEGEDLQALARRKPEPILDEADDGNGVVREHENLAPLPGLDGQG